MKYIGILLCLFSLGSAEELLDVETLATLRMQQYPVEPYKKIAICSARRTGSTLVYNIFKYLFEDQQGFSCPYNGSTQDRVVSKTHYLGLVKLQDFDTVIVITIRNPVDALISNFRTQTEFAKVNIRRFVEIRIKWYIESLILFEKLKEAGRKVILLRYEDFDENFEYLFQCIEMHFGIKIDDEDKQMMKKGYGKENVHHSIQNLLDFSQSLPISGFHGDHLMIGEYNPPEELIDWINLAIEDVKPYFRKYNYLLD